MKDVTHFQRARAQKKSQNFDRAVKAAKYIRSFGLNPTVAVTLGSGLGEVTRRFQATVRIPYEKIPGFRLPSIEGHAGELHLGKWRGVRVAILEGRVHGYEGVDPSAVAFPTRALALTGVETFILTCAAGGIAPKLEPGGFMVFADHLFLHGENPLAGAHDERWGTQFVDLTEAYDPRLRALALNSGRRLRLRCHAGIYASVPGPSYETPAEIRALKILGADAVGMSVVPEVLAARQLGRKVLAVAMITNRAAGLSAKPLAHEEVLAAGRIAASSLARLLDEILGEIGETDGKLSSEPPQRSIRRKALQGLDG